MNKKRVRAHPRAGQRGSATSPQHLLLLPFPSLHSLRSFGVFVGENRSPEVLVLFTSHFFVQFSDLQQPATARAETASRPTVFSYTFRTRALVNRTARRTKLVYPLNYPNELDLLPRIVFPLAGCKTNDFNRVGASKAS
jgi:hypothetical protein